MLLFFEKTKNNSMQFVLSYSSGDDVPSVPKTFEESISLFESSDFAREAFGMDVVEHYSHFFKTEVKAFRRAVTDWERLRYFDRI